LNHQRIQYNIVLFLIAFSIMLAICKLSSDVNETLPPTMEVEMGVTPTRTFIHVRTLRTQPEYLPEQEFYGYYTAAFETSSFVPCSDNEMPDYGKGYWIDIFSSSSFIETYADLIPEMDWHADQSGNLDAIVFVHLIGLPSNPGSPEPHHGHMGLYKQEILVTKLIEMKPFEEGQCN
jgi:hypothetical protein